MPDIFTVSSAGVVYFSFDRSRSIRPVYGIGESQVAYVYEVDMHDVIAPPRLNMVAKAVKARRQAWIDSFLRCVNCNLTEYQHGYDRCWDEYEKRNEAACDEYTRPAPLVVIPKPYWWFEWPNGSRMKVIDL